MRALIERLEYLQEASVVMGHDVVLVDVDQTTSTPEIIKRVEKALSRNKAVKLGRWVMVPPGRVFRLSDKYRTSKKHVPADIEKNEVSIYGVNDFVKAWMKD